MKIAVINFSGNVGKSTIARNLLAPRIPDAEVFAVETINSDGTEDETMKGLYATFLSWHISLNLRKFTIIEYIRNILRFINNHKM